MFFQWAQWQMFAEKSFLKFKVGEGVWNHETGQFDQTFYHLPQHVWDSVYAPWNKFYEGGIMPLRRYTKNYKPKYYTLIHEKKDYTK